MPTEEFTKAASLMFVLLNPFLLSVYLLPVIRKLSFVDFTWVMLRAGAIAAVVFVGFAWFGDFIFEEILQARFAAFLMFGGIVFLVIGVRFVFQGPEAVELLRGEPKQLAGAIAMPFLIGAGTINASVLAGAHMEIWWAALAILGALLAALLIVAAFKWLHDRVSERNEELVDRYADICGRVSALIIGTLAVEMLFQGFEMWLTGSELLPK